MRCLVLDDYQNIASTLADWSSLPFAVDFRHDYIPVEQRAAALADYDILVVMRERTPLPGELLRQLPRLRLIITSGMRNASIDLAAAQAQGITVCGTQSRSEPPAEHTWALLLALARHIAPENHAFRHGGAWQSTLGVGLAGKQLGILGLGKIGSRIARVAQAFDMQVSAWSPNLTQEQAQQHGATLAASKAELLANADIITIHLVLGERSRGLIGAEEFAVMKKSALLINTSRAPIIDENALIAALQQGQIAGAAVDVFNEEPLPRDHILRTLPNLLATPHLGYVCDSNYALYFTQAVEDIHAFLNGAPIRQLLPKA